MRCPSCGKEQDSGGKFCEDCGGRIGAAPAAPPAAAAPVEAGACPQRGAGPEDVDGDGFCTRCGFERVGPARHHLEIVVSPLLAGVSDRGKHHPDNEDFLALASDPAGDVLVVCDGVSTSHRAAAAAETAARAACDAILRGLRDAGAELEAVLVAAVKAAEAAVAALPQGATDGKQPPETTLVAALRRGRTVAVTWLGDSRAYFLTPGGAVPLTEDHSWVNEVVAAGMMTRSQALRAPLAHAITQTVGGPEPSMDPPPVVAAAVPPGPCDLLLCTDGLWNYADAPAELAVVVARRPAGDALGLARNLVEYARQRGGHDNITVAVLRLADR